MRKIHKILFSIFLFPLVLTSCSFEEFWEDVKDAGKTIKEKTTEVFQWTKEATKTAYNKTKDAFIYVYDNVAEWSVDTYNKTVNKSKEIIGDVNEFIKDLKQPKDIDVIEEGDFLPNSTAKSETFVPYYVSSLLANEGYETYNGSVYYKNDLVFGIIFTKNEIFLEDDGEKIPQCGFVQIVNKGYTGLIVSDDIIGTGLVAVSAERNAEPSKTFVVQDYYKFDSFSGIIDDTYFTYKPVSNYAIEVDFKKNISSNYDYSIPLYDFDRDVYLNYKKKESELEKFYRENPDAFSAAVEGSNAIADFIDVQENQNDSLVVFDNDVINNILDEAENPDAVLTREYSKEISGSIGDNIISEITIGNDIVGVEDKNQRDPERLANGLISSIGSGLASCGTISGAVATVVFCATAGSYTVAAIVLTTAACSIVYNVSNMIASIQDVYYGAKGWDKPSNNPVLQLFKQIIPDEGIATLVYHIWGVSNTVLTGLMNPIAKSLQLAKCKGLHIFGKVGAVARASLTYIAKALITGVVAGATYKYVNKILDRVTSNKVLSRMIAFGSSVVVSFFVYDGLSKFDQKFNISGYYVDSVVDTNGIKHYFDENQVEYRTGNNLKPNCKYKINGISYKTDSKGRIINASGKISLNADGRKPIADSMDTIGKGNQAPGDQRGHLVADVLGGSNGVENIVPQSGTLNQGDYKANEMSLLSELRKGSNVSVNIDIDYSGDSFRPLRFIYESIINGESFIKTFFN